MNWDNIKIFATIAKCGSIAQAAAELELNHSTVLRRIHALEQQLAVSLFSRRQSGYEITAAGERILGQALKMEDEALALQRQALAADEAGRGQLRVACPPVYFLELMPMFIDFQRQHPDIELAVEALLELQDLDAMAADVSIRFTNTPPEHYIGREVLRLPFHLYGATDYLSRRGPVTTVTDVDWVIIELATMGADMDPWLRSIDPEVRVAMKVNSASMLMDALEAGLGVGFAPEHLADPSPKLTRMPLFEFDSPIGIWVLSHSDLRYQPRVKNFMAFMRARLRQRYPDYAVADTSDN